jgi:hypothetical protein
MNPIVIREEIVEGVTLKHEIEFIENDIVGITVWDYDEYGGMLSDEYYDIYETYLEDIQPRHLNQIFEQLVNYYLR